MRKLWRERENKREYESAIDPAGIFELVELVGNGTYGQVYKVRHTLLSLSPGIPLSPLSLSVGNSHFDFPSLPLSVVYV
uniref:Protein kinase domain-containing protein n=1 Tax=Hucho hucho TaxID=62062 RepID=A0A4W5KHM2_9TELE